MNCALNVEQQRALFRKVYGDLNDTKSSGRPFLVKDYIQSVYNLIYTKSNDHAMALDYARLVPHYIMRSMIKDDSLMDHLLDSGFNMKDINSIKKSFTNHIDNVEKYIGNNNEALKEIKELQEQVIKNGAKLEPNPLKVQGSKPNPSQEFRAIPPTALADRGQEALSWKEGDPNFNVPNPDVAFYYKVKRKILDLIMEPSADFDSRKINYPGFGPVYLTIMSSSKIPEDQLYPGTPVNSDAHKKGVSMVITDSYGMPMKFNNDLEVDFNGGKMAYYHIRKTEGLVDGNNVNLAPEDMNSVDALVRSSGITRDEAVEVIKQQIKFIHDLREYINKNPQENDLKANINGGSLGYAYNDYVRIKNPLASVNFEGDNFDPFQARENDPQNGLVKGFTYFYTKGMLDTPVEIKLPEMNAELKDKLVSLFAEDLYEKDPSGNTYSVSPADRQRLIDNYIKTGPDTIQLIPNSDNKTYAVMIKGEKVDPSDPMLFKQAINDYFNAVAPSKTVAANRIPSGATILKSTDPSYQSKMKSGDYVEMIDNGKSKFYLVEGRKLHTNNKSLNKDFDDVSFDKTQAGVTYLQRTPTPYNEFIRQNFNIDYQLNGENKLVKLNAYFTFAPIDSELEKIYGVNDAVKEAETTTPTDTVNNNNGPADQLGSIDDLLKDTFEDPELNKLLDNKAKGLQATLDQISEAKTWYANHPLSKQFPFTTMFHAINTKNPNAAATWTKHGITLFKGADYSDLYHEAWHAFSQTFLPKAERAELYNEARKLSGSFVDYNGKSVRFNKATDLQIEEYLAEDFREYVLKGTVKKGSPKRNNIFRRILDFLKTLFGKSSVIDITDNDKAQELIHDLYEKLRVGDLHEYSFNAENRNFDILNKGVGAVSLTEPQKSLDYDNSKLMVDTIDSLISEYIDRANMGLNEVEKLRAAELTRKAQINSITPEEKSELTGLQSRQSYKYTSSILKTENGLKNAYKYAQIRLATIRNQMNSSLATAKELEKERIQKNVDLLDYVIRNYGNTDVLSDNKEGKGMIAYHKLKSKYINQEDVEEFFEEENQSEEEKYSKGKEGYDRGGNETSFTEMASKEVLYLMSSLHKVNEQNVPVLNKLGVAELHDFDTVKNRFIRMLQNTLSIEDMYNKLSIESDTFPPAKQILNKLGPVRTDNARSFNLWTSFWQSFNKTRVPLTQMTVEKTSTDDNGVKLAVPTYAVRIGEASADYKKVGQKWENYFKTAYDNPYIKTDNFGANYLDTKKVLEDFPQNTLSGREYEFFRAIGMRLSDKNEIHDDIRKKNTGNAKALRNALFLINQRGNITVDSLASIVKEYPAMVIGELSYPKIPGEKRNYNNLQELEARYSDDFSNFMVSNAKGDPQFEHSLNNTLTVMINTINSVKSYDDLMQIPHMSYLDIDRNPFASASIWLNSIFDMNKPGRPKRRQSDDPKSPFVTVNLNNLSGVLTMENGESTGEGVASAQADEFTKLILDFHLTIVNGTPELMRHADKGTSFSVWLSNINTKSESKRLYVDTTSFISINDRIPGYTEAYSLVIPYINAELKRINEMKRLSETGVQNFDFGYLERGKEFVIFDDNILSKDVKQQLLDLQIPLEDYLKTNTPESNNLNAEIFKGFVNYMNTQSKNIDAKFTEAKFVADSVITTIKSEASKKQIKNVNEVSAYNAAVTSFAFNNWIHNIESLIFLYGDLALYKDLHKRIAGTASTGDIFRTDKAAVDYVNKVLGSKYAEQMNIPSQPFDGTFNTAVMTDNEIGSEYYKEYLKAIGDEKAAKAYADGQMNEGDAQGWITFDAYRTLLNLEGKWLDEHEKLYMKLVKGEDVNTRDITKFFPTKKVQYFGPLDTQGLPVTAFHKFSLFPLIPSVIKGTNLENLHKKMMTNNTHYALFKSGSKVATITKSGKTDKFYENGKTRKLSEETFTNNKVFLEFLKDQLEIAPKYKNKVIFSTQLRKLVENGLMENKVPIDFRTDLSLNDKRAEWDKLSETDKRKNSDIYTQISNYENNLNKLNEVKKKELLKEAGWKMENGTPTGSVENLLSFVSKELARQDLSDHELDFIQVGPDGQIKHDLSMSLSADKIEKLLNAIVNKRLVKQKVNGEGLIQVSGAGFEKLDAYTNPEEKDLAKWGTNDLPTYHKGTDGKTTAMKVKIAMQGQFEKLLDLPSVKDYAYSKNIDRLAALNALLKDEDWLNQNENRRAVTMVGVRIPVQGLNSMEFMEVFEFLPKYAGNIIVPPAEIVAKSGSDFDIDKLTVMMPTFRYVDGILEVARQYSEKSLRDLYEKTKKAKLEAGLLKDSQGKVISRDSNRIVDGELKQLDMYYYNDLIKNIFGFDPDVLDQELIDEILSEEKMPTYEEFSEKINGSKSIENDIIWNIREILESPINYSKLIKPNGTYSVEPLAQQLKNKVMTYNPKKGVFNQANDKISTSRLLEYTHNLDVHSSNNIGKETLGLGAVDNTYNSIFNRIGAKLNKSYTQGKGNQAYNKRLTILLPHNTVKTGNEDVISLSHIMDKDNVNDISDIISQLMNGWVDIAKDAWIFNIQGNKEIAPSLLFMVQAGVPFKHAVYLVSQPLIREYVKQQKLAKSTFAEPLGKAATNPSFFRSKAREVILENPKFGFKIVKNTKGVITDKAIYEETVKLTDANPNAFDMNELEKVIDNYASDVEHGIAHQYTDAERATFLHFLELENISRSVAKVKMTLNVDTSISKTLFEAESLKVKIIDLENDGIIDKDIVNNVKTGSPISSFFIYDFQNEIWKDLFKLRNHPVLNKFLVNKFRDGNKEQVDKTFGDNEKFANEFRNDFMSFIFQNTVKDFDINSASYKGLNIDEIKVSPVASLQFGAIVKDSILYVDKDQLKKDFTRKTYSTEDYTKKGLAMLPANAFPYDRDYYKFVFERESLRALYPIDKLTQSEDYQDKYEHNLSNHKNRLENETEQSFVKRMRGVTYEEMLRDMALDNTFNSWKIFNSNNSYADQFLRIREKYPELSADYNIIKSLSLSLSKTGFKNLKLNDTLLDADKINVLHENLLALSNPSVKKVNDPIENERISLFFSRFSTYAFLQSGLNVKSSFSLVRLVPQDNFVRIMEEPVKEYIKNLNDLTLEKYYNRFLSVNDIANSKTRIRFKDYAINNSNVNKESKLGLVKKDDVDGDILATTKNDLFSEDYVGNLIYDAQDLKISTAKELAESNKDITFIYNDATVSRINAAKYDFSLAEASNTLGNVFGIPTRKAFAGTDTSFSDVLSEAGVHMIDPKNKAIIDNAIQALIKLKNDGATLAFSKAGYGQYMLGADDSNGANPSIARAKAPKTFLYLSEQLFRNFGYKNPNYIDTATGRKVIQSTQEVSDEMVKDMLNHCFNS
jgi:hypothetical protein